MDDKDKAHLYLELYKAQLRRFNATRDFEWRINLALWSSIGILTSFLIGKITIDSSAAWLFFTIFPWHFIWMIQIQQHEDIDEHLMRDLRKQIQGS